MVDFTALFRKKAPSHNGWEAGQQPDARRACLIQHVDQVCVQLQTRP